MSADGSFASNHHVSALPRLAGVQSGVTVAVAAALVPPAFVAVTERV